ncbi:MAG: chloride channel protein [Phycisphaerales bacterium]|nr:MAG: chloride channel protein [Phycisphaerales bacterium]
MKTLVGCGAAAGIAATFNAPMAGTLFALELIVTDFKQEIQLVAYNRALDTVVDRFAQTGIDRLPVTDDRGRLAGSIVMSDIMRQYSQEVVNRNISIELGARIAAQDPSHTLNIGEHTSIAEIDVPHWMVGKTVGDIQLRSNYGISVFLAKEIQDDGEPRFVTPGPSYEFRAGDTILVSGKPEDINNLVKKA